MPRRDQAVDKHLGARVRAARTDRKLSQTVLGDQIGVSFQQVQKYELGKDRISASQLLGIARTLEKDISFFFEDMGEVDDDAEAGTPSVQRPGGSSRTTTSYDIKIIRMLHAIDDEQVKMKLFGLMEAIVAARRAPVRPDVETAAEPWFEGRFDPEDRLPL